jgi:hypothetical protein
MSSAMGGEDSDRNHERPYATSLGAERGIGYRAGVNLAGSSNAIVVCAGGVGAAALDRNGQQHRFLAARRQREGGVGERSLPSDFLAGCGYESAQGQHDVAFAAGIVFKGNGNLPHFPAARILDRIGAVNMA